MLLALARRGGVDTGSEPASWRLRWPTLFPHGWQLWRDWQAVVAPDNTAEIQAVEADRGSYLGYVRLVGRRRAEARLEQPIVSISSEYRKKPLLRAAGVE